MIDRNAGLAYCDGDEDFYSSVLQDFADESAGKIPLLENYLKTGDLDGYRILVHSLISTGKLIGAMHLAELAAEHQKAAIEKNTAWLSSSVSALTGEYTQVVNEIRDILRQTRGN